MSPRSPQFEPGSGRRRLGFEQLEERRLLASFQLVTGPDSSALNPTSVSGLSPHGETIVGRHAQQAFRWTEVLGFEQLANPVQPSQATAVSAGGLTVVGTYVGQPTPALQQGFVWAGEAAPALIESDAGQTALTAEDVSADGRFVVGALAGPAGSLRAYRWTAGILGQGAFEDLGNLPNWPPFFLQHSVALGVSYDGAVIVGNAGGALSLDVPFRWSVGGMERLPDAEDATVTGVSGDGRVVVGRAFVGAVPLSRRANSRPITPSISSCTLQQRQPLAITTISPSEVSMKC